MSERKSDFLGFDGLKGVVDASNRISRNLLLPPITKVEHVIYPLECKLVVTKIAQAMPIFKV